MNTFIIILGTVLCVFVSSGAYCQSLAALPIRGEESLMRVIESRHKEQIEEQYRAYLSTAQVNIEIADLEIETRVTPSRDDIGSYDINLYYVDPTETGCSERLLHVAMHGATMAHRLKDAEIGTITAFPMFPGTSGKESRKMRGIVVITYCLHEKKELFARISDGKLRNEDIAEMNSWLRAWKEVRLDPAYNVQISFK